MFIECALFDPVRVALTGRRHQIVSDARQRFERGIDAALMPDAVEAATAMILELCGGEPGEVTGSRRRNRTWQRSATLRFDAVGAFGGADIPPDDGGGVAGAPRLRACSIAMRNRSPSRCRPGATTSPRLSALDQSPTLDPAVAAKAAEGCAEIEPECDLIEEVLRLRGLDAVPPVSLPRVAPVPTPTLTPQQHAPRWPAARWRRRAWPNASPSASWQRTMRNCSATRRKRCA